MLPIYKTLSDRALRGVVDKVHPGASVLSVQQLQGGIDSFKDKGKHQVLARMDYLRKDKFLYK
ncbi:hypothetical protein J2Z66_004638 [Paenibacillus eucommiae]|uniref:Uncharacterized protein n=1 Tax=Paenibacillus eucommiae TaxID=1355755 RepID=A0ABS4IZN3_9BACL|nr:hypothetical protein [Paenibacillus eucommiae]